jgi:O-succinylhomoserine sulfhydrylase
VSPEAKAAAGVGEGLIRLAVGLVSVGDLKADLLRGLGD